MSEMLAQIRKLAAEGRIRISAHGYDELAEDDIFLSDVLSGLETAVVVEDYPAATRSKSVLHMDREGRPIHVVWGIVKNTDGPVVLIQPTVPILNDGLLIS
jgi:hypothetical protein